MKTILFLVTFLFAGLFSSAQSYVDSVLKANDSIARIEIQQQKQQQPTITKSHNDSIAKQDALQIPSDSIPKAKGWVNDFEGIYSKGEAKSLDSLIRSFEKRTGYEIAIITVDMNLTTDTGFDNYIFAVANAWGVGKKGKDNGIVIGISSEFKSLRIINGAGVSMKLSDAATKDIIDNIFIANFKDGNYYKGTKEGLLSIMEKLK